MGVPELVFLLTNSGVGKFTYKACLGQLRDKEISIYPHPRILSIYIATLTGYRISSCLGSVLRSAGSHVFSMTSSSIKISWEELTSFSYPNNYHLDSTESFYP